MLKLVLQHVLQHNADLADLNLWLRCLVVSRSIRDAVISLQGRNAMIRKQRVEERLLWFRMDDALDEAVEVALQTVSKKPWKVEDHLCCSLYCRFSGNTGIWIPRHVPICRLPEEDRMAIQSLWWREKYSTSDFYASSDPQSTVEEHKSRRPNGKYYVVCSEACFHKVKRAVSVIHMRNSCHVEIILGVDELTLSYDKGDRTQATSENSQKINSLADAMEMIAV